MKLSSAEKETPNTILEAPPDTIINHVDRGDSAKEPTAVKLLVFDMGHVFIDFKFEAVCLGFCSRAGVELHQFKPALSRLSKLGYEIGKIDTAEFLANVNVELRKILPASDTDWNDISLSEFHELWNFDFSENVEMVELFSELKGKRPLALLSNTNESHFDSLESKFKVTRHFDKVFLSYVLGLQKPDPKIYQHVIAEAGLRPEEIVFVDDLAPNIKAAHDLGIVAILFENPTQLKEELRRMHLLD